MLQHTKNFFGCRSIFPNFQIAKKCNHSFMVVVRNGCYVSHNNNHRESHHQCCLTNDELILSNYIKLSHRDLKLCLESAVAQFQVFQKMKLCLRWIPTSPPLLFLGILDDTKIFITGDLSVTEFCWGNPNILYLNISHFHLLYLLQSGV